MIENYSRSFGNRKKIKEKVGTNEGESSKKGGKEGRKLRSQKEGKKKYKKREGEVRKKRKKFRRKGRGSLERRKRIGRRKFGEVRKEVYLKFI
jgi:hypothetical protein